MSTPPRSRSPNWAVSYKYPSNWEKDEDFMGTHFLARGTDDTLWKQQKIFWNECIRLYASQLCDCPIAKISKLSFNPNDIESVYTSEKYSLKPLCIIDILEDLKNNGIILAELDSQLLHDESKYNSPANTNGKNTNDNSSIDASTTMKNIMKSVVSTTITAASVISSGVSGLVNFGFGNELTQSQIIEGMKAKYTIKQNTPLVHKPTLDQLCDQLQNWSLQCFEHTSFHSKSNTPMPIARSESPSVTSMASMASSVGSMASMTPNKSSSSSSFDLLSLQELVAIGVCECTTKDMKKEIIINGLVFNRFCQEIYRLTRKDILLIKKYLLKQKRIAVYYINNDVVNDSDNENENEEKKMEATATNDESYTMVTSTEDLYDINVSRDTMKNEMIKFAGEKNQVSCDLTPESINQMRCISIHLRFKYFEKQKLKDELRRDKLQSKIRHQLTQFKKEISENGSKLSDEQLKTKKQKFLNDQRSKIATLRWIKQRITRLDTTLDNLDTVLQHIEDANTNSMIFDALVNADNVLKSIQSKQPNVEEIKQLYSNIGESIDKNNDISQALAETDHLFLDVNDKDIESQLNEIETMQAIENIDKTMPDVPSHNVDINMNNKFSPNNNKNKNKNQNKNKHKQKNKMVTRQKNVDKMEDIEDEDVDTDDSTKDKGRAMLYLVD